MEPTNLSGAIKGITEAQAKMIIEKYGSLRESALKAIQDKKDLNDQKKGKSQ